MSDLIEKAARGICADAWRRCGASDVLVALKVDEEWWKHRDEARAAIAAVAEWLEDGTHGLTDGELYLAARIRKQLEQPK